MDAATLGHCGQAKCAPSPGRVAIDTGSQAVTEVVFQGEARQFALQRQRELRPDHTGRPVRFEYRNEERDDVREMSAVHPPKELRAVIDRIEAKALASR